MASLINQFCVLVLLTHSLLLSRLVMLGFVKFVLFTTGKHTFMANICRQVSRRFEKCRIE